MKTHSPISCAQMYAQFQAAIAAESLTDVLHCHLKTGAKLADAPRRALRKHRDVQSWHDFSGGIGRLSDHVNMLRRWLEVYQPDQRIASAPMIVKVAGRVTRVHAYWLEQSAPISVLQLSLFNETGLQ